MDMIVPSHLIGFSRWIPGGGARHASGAVRSAPSVQREVTMAEQPEQPDQKDKPGGYGGGYGGGRWKKWLLIYLIAAGIIYLIVYLVFFADGGYGS
jgi:hypothetical protein